MGVDLAKHVDFTVLTVIDKTTHRVVYWDRFNEINYSLQKAKIESVAARYNNALVRVDSTGVGDPIVEDLIRGDVRCEPFIFTNKTKAELIENLLIMIDEGKVKYPKIPELLQELNSFTFKELGSGKIRYEAPDSGHDDCVMSLALACYRLGKKEEPNLTVGGNSRDYVRYLEGGGVGWKPEVKFM